MLIVDLPRGFLKHQVQIYVGVRASTNDVLIMDDDRKQHGQQKVDELGKSRNKRPRVRSRRVFHGPHTCIVNLFKSCRGVNEVAANQYQRAH